MLRDETLTNENNGQTQYHHFQSQDDPLRLLYEVSISPVAALVNGDELVIVPEGPLCLAPYAAFIDSNLKHLCESFRIRMIPSLSSLKLIADCPADYHMGTGALLVGDPWVQEISKKKKNRLEQLPGAREEVETIGKILQTTPQRQQKRKCSKDFPMFL